MPIWRKKKKEETSRLQIINPLTKKRATQKESAWKANVQQRAGIVEKMFKDAGVSEKQKLEEFKRAPAKQHERMLIEDLNELNKLTNMRKELKEKLENKKLKQNERQKITNMHHRNLLKLSALQKVVEEENRITYGLKNKG